MRSREHRPATLQETHKYAGKIILTLCVTLLAFFTLPSGQAQSFDLVYTFNGVVGANPRGSLLLDSLGNSYGTTSSGGSNLEGTVFKVSPSGKATRLYSFTGGTDGRAPSAGVIADANGHLHGPT